jgi:hypothetical protein
MEAAMKRDDPVAAIQAYKPIVEASQELPLQQDDEQALNALVGQVVDFAEKFGSYQDTARYGQDPDEHVKDGY